MRKLRILGIVGLIFGTLVLIAGLVLLVLTLLAVIILIPFLPLAGGSISGSVFQPALATTVAGIALIIISVIAVAMGGTKKETST